MCFESMRVYLPFQCTRRLLSFVLISVPLCWGGRGGWGREGLRSRQWKVKLLVTANSKSQSIVNVIFWMFWKSLQQISMANQDIVVNCDILPRAASAERAVLRGVAWVGTHWRRTRSGMGRARTREWWGSGWRPGKLEKCINKASPLSLKELFTQKCKSIYFLILLSWQVSYLDELERETEDPEGLCLLRPRGGEPMRPGLLLGDLDLRQGSFHSSGLLGNEPISFLGGGSIGPLKRKRGFRRRKQMHL